jgi:hypothetical protein
VVEPYWIQHSPEIYPSPQPKLQVQTDHKAVIAWDDNALMLRPRVE